MLSAMSSAVAAMRAAEARLQLSAARIAQMGGSPSAPGGWLTGADTSSPVWLAGAQVDPAGELLDQVEAGASFVANLKTLETIQDLVKRLYGLAE